MKKTAPPPAITSQMVIADIVALCPQAREILAEYGLHCVGCAANAFETLHDGCSGHGFEQAEIDELVDDLNTILREQPPRPMTLTVTASAAQAIQEVREREQKTTHGLAVILDGQGGFCMEFQEKPNDDDKTFSHPEAPDIPVYASSLTLARIGGSTIDFRDGRFKLDLADAGGCGCEHGGCGCGKK